MSLSEFWIVQTTNLGFMYPSIKIALPLLVSYSASVGLPVDEYIRGRSNHASGVMILPLTSVAAFKNQVRHSYPPCRLNM